MRVRLVILEREIVIGKAEDVANLRIQPHDRKRIRAARELLTRLIEMVQMKMGIAEGMDEFARLQAGDLRHHHCQQRIGGDVERHAQKYIGGALVELTRKLSV